MRGPRAYYLSPSGSLSRTRGPRINLLLAAGFAMSGPLSSRCNFSRSCGLRPSARARASIL
jgi:hypothetical protein